MVFRFSMQKNKIKSKAILIEKTVVLNCYSGTTTKKKPFFFLKSGVKKTFI